MENIYNVTMLIQNPDDIVLSNNYHVLAESENSAKELIEKYFAEEYPCCYCKVRNIELYSRFLKRKKYPIRISY